MDWEILRKYTKGTCSQDELRKLGEWLQENSANEDFFTTYIEQWDSEDHDSFEADAQQAWQEFKKSGSLSSDTEISHSSGLGVAKYRYPTTRQKGSRYWYSFAAAAIILVVTLFFTAQQIIVLDDHIPKEKIAVQQITTTKGQRTSLRLSDGTFVMLNADSKLKIPKNYGNRTRKIYLEGEAFFEVTHDKTNPFLVITPQGFVKDLGTQFNVMAYDSSTLEVAVKEGLASLGRVQQGIPQKELVELSPNKLGKLNKKKGLTVSDIGDMSEFTGWTRGKLVFQNTPFPKVVERLERWFAIDGIIKDSALTQRTLTATYDKMPLNEILDVLSISLDITYTQQKNKIEFQAHR